jgi:hypothetical protein
LKSYKLHQPDNYVPPTPPPSPFEPASGKAGILSILTLIAGILTLVGFWCCWAGFLGVIPVIMGIVELNLIKSGKSSPSGKRMTILGLTAGALALVLSFVMLILGFGINLFNNLK